VTERDKSVDNSVIMMPSTDKKTDETKLKKSYKEIVRQYLPQTWVEYEVDEFIEALFNGIYVPRIPDRYASSEFVRAISRIHKKWLFSTMPVRNEKNTMIIGWKYFPNPNVVKYKKKTTEKPQDQYQKL
jgi:hypothetical protein